MNIFFNIYLSYKSLLNLKFEKCMFSLGRKIQKETCDRHQGGCWIENKGKAHKATHGNYIINLRNMIISQILSG